LNLVDVRPQKWLVHPLFSIEFGLLPKHGKT
jgi:hypothetical protein